MDVVVIGEVDSSTAGTYTLTSTASDGQGNQADPVTRTVNVEVVDNDPPVIVLVGDASMSIDLGSTFTEPGVRATDAVDGEVTVTTSGSVNTSIAGSYTLTYTAKDAGKCCDSRFSVGNCGGYRYNGARDHLAGI